jgi:hypothetical protein
MGKENDLRGKKFGRVCAVEKLHKNHNRKTMWRCLCECGVEFICIGSNLVSGTTKSCGCFKLQRIKESKFKHGCNQSNPTYLSWHAMKMRCKKRESYILKGISVCDRWINSFENFLEDVGDRPRNTTLDRINNNGNYEPNNCRWASPKTQRRNSDAIREITVDNETMIVTDWAAKLGTNAAAIIKRINRGWSERDAVLRPVTIKLTS